MQRERGAMDSGASGEAVNRLAQNSLCFRRDGDVCRRVTSPDFYSSCTRLDADGAVLFHATERQRMRADAQ